MTTAARHAMSWILVGLALGATVWFFRPPTASDNELNRFCVEEARILKMDLLRLRKAGDGNAFASVLSSREGALAVNRAFNHCVANRDLSREREQDYQTRFAKGMLRFCDARAAGDVAAAQTQLSQLVKQFSEINQMRTRRKW